MIGTILVVFAFVLACLAAFLPGPVFNRVHLGWASLAFFYASILAGHLVR